MLKWARTLFVLLAVGATPVLGDEPIPITGTYMRDAPCKDDGSDRPDLLVKITKDQIESEMGVCEILNWERDGKTILAHVECSIAGGQPLLGEVSFRIRDDSTLDFQDQDRTSDGVLHKCAK